VHPEPTEEKLKKFAAYVAIFGYKMNLKDLKTVVKSYNDINEEIKGKPEQNLIEQMAIRSMSKAIYTTNNVGHFGLAFSHYSHFTSPIRRYPDLLTHRILQLALDGKDLPATEHLEKMCTHCSERERNAAQAERASIKYKQVEMMSEHVGEEFEGIISGMKDFGFFVELIKSKAEGMVRFSNISGDRFTLDMNGFLFRSQKNGKKYSMGDTVTVVIAKTDLFRRSIDLEWVINK
jgi:VacB/RNase II family 3'-5' exoribonuclease